MCKCHESIDKNVEKIVEKIVTYKSNSSQYVSNQPYNDNAQYKN